MDKFQLVGSEVEFNLALPGGNILNGFIDGILTLNGRNWLLENKFMKQASIKHVDLDAQVSIYMLAAYALGYNPVGTLYNVVRMSDGPTAEKEPVLRAYVYRNAEGLRTIQKEILEQMEEMEEFHQGKLRVFRNPTKDCSWDCQFYKVCLDMNDCGSPDATLKTYLVKDYKNDSKIDGGSDE
jgi:hypothetical protein